MVFDVIFGSFRVWLGNSEKDRFLDRYIRRYDLFQQLVLGLRANFILSSK